MVNNILILLFSFIASLAFSFTFGIHGKDKLLNISLSSFLDNRFVIILISALAASLYGDFMSRKLQVPTAYFIYPSIIPLIPGDMFHYMIASLVTGNIRLAEVQAFDCILSLVALSLGTIIGTTTLQSIRRK